MDRIVSSEFYNILSQISDVDFNPQRIFEVFGKELPGIALKYGYVLFKAKLYEPVKRSNEMKVTEIVLYDGTNGEACNVIELEYPTGNGGKVIVTTGLSINDIWTEQLKEDSYVVSRIIYLLVGRAKTMASLQNLLFYDQLTGISNETGLNRFMGTTIAQCRFTNYCTNFINIKNMKLLNNKYSNKNGNIIMAAYAKAINDFAMNVGNGIAARLGGDNFLVFIEKEHEDQFIEFINNLRVPYSERLDDLIKIDTRLGYYFIKAGDGIDEAMRNSDIAFKLTRNPAHTNVVKFEESMKIRELKLRQLEHSIPDAIANREFVVYYQPKVDISDENEFKLNGAEALVRWQKNGELVPPNEFVPILERSGAISAIDYYVLEQICVDINDWISRGLTPVKVSSNFSRRHLQDPDFADKVEAIILKNKVDPKYIEIEITESYDDEDMQALMKFEKKMHEIGVELSVDDFGSGFSSIRMIKNIVADTIKLDKSIIDGIGNGGPDDIIVSNIINMINCLGKNVIAEGVETEVQAKFLRENDCNNIQGYLFARPCPKDEYEKFMK